MEDFWTRVKRRGAYIALMEDLIGKEIATDVAVKENDDDLNISCNFFNDIIGKRDNGKRKSKKKEDDGGNIITRKQVLYVGTDKKYKGKFLEPCPLCCSGNIDNKFEIVFIGLNPHREAPYQRDTMTWKELSEYQMPSSISSSPNIYKRIANKLLKKGEYYDSAFRLHQALLCGRKYQHWEDIPAENIRELFLKEFEQRPVLALEMIPYKSKTYSLSDEQAEELEKIKGYKNYLNDLLSLIEEYASDTAWIIFLGHPNNVKRFLYNNRKKYPVVPNDVKEDFSNYEYVLLNPLETEKRKRSWHNHFFRFFWGKRKVIISPFIYGHGSEIPLQPKFFDDLDKYFGSNK